MLNIEIHSFSKLKCSPSTNYLRRVKVQVCKYVCVWGGVFVDGMCVHVQKTGVQG